MEVRVDVMCAGHWNGRGYIQRDQAALPVLPRTAASLPGDLTLPSAPLQDPNRVTVLMEYLSSESGWKTRKTLKLFQKGEMKKKLPTLRNEKLLMDRIKLLGKHMLTRVKMKNWTKIGKEGEREEQTEERGERRAGPSGQDLCSWFKSHKLPFGGGTHCSCCLHKCT